jgi:hypothetical protein
MLAGVAEQVFEQIDPVQLWGKAARIVAPRVAPADVIEASGLRVMSIVVAWARQQPTGTSAANENRPAMHSARGPVRLAGDHFAFTS